MGSLFDRASDPSPLPASIAVRRGRNTVNIPSMLLIVVGAGAAKGLFGHSVIFALVALLAGFALGWLWWSIVVPRWRHWALARGADADELQALGERANLLWPKGSAFERTEVRRHDR